MQLKDQLVEDMKQAMKSKDKVKLSVIRMVRAAIKNSEINQKIELNEEEVIAILNRELKQRKDSLHEFKAANRDDLASATELEIAVLMDYLPEQLSEAEIESLVKQTIAETGATTKKEMGLVMQKLMPKLQGKADGKLVNQIVQKNL